jgi:hypothetical protein
MFGNLLVGCDAAIDANGELRKIFFQLISSFIAQGRNFAIFFWAKTF